MNSYYAALLGGVALVALVATVPNTGSREHTVAQGEAENYARSLTAYHRAAARYVANTPGFTGEIPRAAILANMPALPGVTTSQGPWTSFADASGNVFTFVTQSASQPMKGALVGNVASSLARLANGDAGAGIARNGLFVSAATGHSTPLPAGVAIANNVPVYMTAASAADPTRRARDSLETWKEPCPAPSDGTILMGRQVTHNPDGSQTLGPTIELARACDPGLTTADFRTEACDPALYAGGLMFYRRDIQYKGGIATPGEWNTKPEWSTCVPHAVPGNPTLQTVNASWSIISQTPETTAGACPAGQTGQINSQRTVTTYSGPFGNMTVPSAWQETSRTCTPALEICGSEQTYCIPGGGNGGGDEGGGTPGSGNSGDGTGGTSGGATGPGAGPGGSAGDGDGGSGGGGGSGCFVTTAAIKAAALADDCHQLQMMRRLRDQYVSTIAGGAAAIDIYKKVAPHIVAAVDRHPNSQAIWRHVLEQWIEPGVALMEANQFHLAHHHYRAMVLSLIEEHLIEDLPRDLVIWFYERATAKPFPTDPSQYPAIKRHVESRLRARLAQIATASFTPS
jgi:hypothetical protein